MQELREFPGPTLLLHSASTHKKVVHEIQEKNENVGSLLPGALLFVAGFRKMNIDDIEKSRHKMFGPRWECPECGCDNDEQIFACRVCLFSIFFNFHGGIPRKTGTFYGWRKDGDKRGKG